MLRGHVFLGSTTRPSCLHQGERVTLRDCPLHTAQRCRWLTASLGRACSFCSCRATLMHFTWPSWPEASILSHNGATTGVKESYTESSPHDAHQRHFAKHDATCERDCCKCVSLRDSVVISICHRRFRKHRQPLPQMGLTISSGSS